jgi:3-(3-hydroxy-phenyl)propionate hydroxylase
VRRRRDGSGCARWPTRLSRVRRAGGCSGYVGGTFALLAFDAAIDPSDVASLARDRIGCRVVNVGGPIIAGAAQIDDLEGLAHRRYDARPGTVYLIRPDQHVCARWRAFDLGHVRAAIALATCNR